jgi:predicted N-acetyltransferase YhbS
MAERGRRLAAGARGISRLHGVRCPIHRRPGESKYYERFGFQTASSLGITNEYGVNDEFLIAVANTASLSPGLVKYAPEFGDISTSH